jgi:hypothetical protein
VLLSSVVTEMEADSLLFSLVTYNEKTRLIQGEHSNFERYDPIKILFL